MAKPLDQRFHPEESPFEEAVRRFADFFDGVIIKDDDDIDLPTGRPATPSAAPASVNVAKLAPNSTDPHYSQLDLLDQPLHHTLDRNGKASYLATLPVLETPDSLFGNESETTAAKYSQLNLLDQPPDATHDWDKSKSASTAHAPTTPKGRVGNAPKTTKPRYSQLNLID